MSPRSRFSAILPALALVFLFTPAVVAQHTLPEPLNAHDILEKHQVQPPPVSSLQDVFGFGTISGHVRNYFMNTINKGSLKDYYANATGGSLRFHSREFHGFRFGIAGIFTYRLFSSDLNTPDPTTGEISKWENELFDVLDPENFNDLDRLEELFITYRFSKGQVTYGKLEIDDTPLMNRQDGRMKPFAFKGVWLDLAPWQQHGLQLAWIDRISPRSTVEWFDFDTGIGLSPQGFQPNGQEAGYGEFQESKGLALLGYRTQWRNFNVEFYQWYLHHMSNTSWVELEYGRKHWSLGMQYALQFPDNFQKGLDYQQRYVQPEERGQVLSGQVRYAPGDWNFRAAYTRAFDSGRFLFPRELGRDHFYTSIPRSRLEGFGDVGAITLGGEYSFARERFLAGFEVTQVRGPAIDSFEFNKYNLDSYRQANGRVEYAFDGFLDGLHLSLLYVYRENRNNSAPEVIFNRSNLHQINFVANFEF